MDHRLYTACVRLVYAWNRASAYKLLNLERQDGLVARHRDDTGDEMKGTVISRVLNFSRATISRVSSSNLRPIRPPASQKFSRISQPTLESEWWRLVYFVLTHVEVKRLI